MYIYMCIHVIQINIAVKRRFNDTLNNRMNTIYKNFFTTPVVYFCGTTPINVEYYTRFKYNGIRAILTFVELGYRYAERSPMYEM